MKKTISAITAVILLLAVLYACGTKPSGENTLGSLPDTSSPSGGDEADSLLAQINAVTLDGKEMTGADFAGEKLTVLNVWATWCPPCISELPHLQEVSEAYADKGVTVVGVMHDGINRLFEPQEDVIKTGKALLADAGADYTIILPDATLINGPISTMQYFPTTFFINAGGEIIKTIIGGKDAAGWGKEIDGALSDIS